MNKLKNKQKDEKTQQQAPRPSALARMFIGILDGSFLTSKNGARHLYYAAFIAFLGVLYIGNSYQAEKIVRQSSKIAEELKEYRSEYVSLKSNLMFRSNQSEVAKIAPKGLRESKEPPYKLFVNSDKPNSTTE